MRELYLQAEQLLNEQNYSVLQETLLQENFDINYLHAYSLPGESSNTNSYFRQESKEITATLLHIAIKNNAPCSIIQLLLENNANPNLTYVENQTWQESFDNGIGGNGRTDSGTKELTKFSALDIAVINKQKEAIKLLQRYKATSYDEAAKKTYQQCYAQKAKKKQKYKSRLFVGEGDFGYSRSIIAKHVQDKPELGKYITVTEYDDEATLAKRFQNGKNNSFVKNVAYLKKYGVTVQYSINARKLEIAFPDQKFSRIHFCCPHTGGSDTDTLVNGFFQSACNVQEIGNRIHIVLAGEDNKAWWQGKVYKIVDAITHSGYLFFKKRDFNSHGYQHYLHRNTFGTKSSDAAKKLGEYIFEKNAITGPSQLRQLNHVRTGIVQGESVQFFSPSLPLESGSSSYEEQDDLPSPDISFSLTESPSSPQSSSNVSTTYQISGEEKLMHQQNWQAQCKKLQEENQRLQEEKQQLQQENKNLQEVIRATSIPAQALTIQKYAKRWLAMRKIAQLRQQRQKHREKLPAINAYLLKIENYSALAFIANGMIHLGDTEAISAEIEKLFQEALQYPDTTQENKITISTTSTTSTTSSENNQPVFPSNNTLFKNNPLNSKLIANQGNHTFKNTANPSRQFLGNTARQTN